MSSMMVVVAVSVALEAAVLEVPVQVGVTAATPRLLIRGGGAPTPGQADGDARTGEAAMVGPHRRGRRIGSGLDEPRLVHQLGRMFGEGVVGGRMLLGLCE
eukprot:jgi/Undpi1/8438/HiC_scaffold_25.g10906.m1